MSIIGRPIQINKLYATANELEAIRIDVLNNIHRLDRLVCEIAEWDGSGELYQQFRLQYEKLKLRYEKLTPALKGELPDFICALTEMIRYFNATVNEQTQESATIFSEKIKKAFQD